MIAAYRAERLTQRPVFRTALRDSHLARRAARIGDPPVTEASPPAVADQPAAPAAAVEPQPETGKSSVFAGLVSTAVAEQEASRLQDAEQHAARPREPDPAEDPAPEAVVAEPQKPQTPDPVAPPEPYDPPLAEIGFGPGMLIRLSQLGLHTTSDLAQANPTQLRSELGEISRLVDVDAWIRSARQTNRAAAGS